MRLPSSQEVADNVKRVFALGDFLWNRLMGPTDRPQDRADGAPSDPAES